MRPPDAAVPCVGSITWQRVPVARVRPMRLTPGELDRLTIFAAAELARRHRARGLKLNHPEAVALIADEMHEAARAGASYEEVQQLARQVLTEDDVLDGVVDLVDSLRLECLFADGTRVLIVERPIQPRDPPREARS